MNSKQRVLAAIQHREPDRVPLGIWLYQKIFGSEKLRAEIENKYGSLENFYAAFGIDLLLYVMPFPYKNYVPGLGGTFQTGLGGVAVEDITPEHFRDPDDPVLYTGLEQFIATHPAQAIVAHVWGVVEAAYSFMGVEATLMNMVAQPELMARFFSQLGQWSARMAEHAIARGADIVQISADAGASNGMLFSPKQWWSLVYPNDKLIAAAIKRRGKPVAMHNDGNIWQIMDGIVALGVDVLHPIQTSAGMDLRAVKQQYGDRLTINGGLDITRVLSDTTDEELVAIIRDYMNVLKPRGGFIVNTEHFVPETILLTRIELAYRTAFQSGRYG
jgi:uroporphyrinogen decarboxylase